MLSEDFKHKNPHYTIAVYWAQLCFGKIKRKYKSKTLFISKDYLIKKVKRQIFCLCIRDKFSSKFENSGTHPTLDP